MECFVSKGEMSRNDVAGIEENESQPECFTDEVFLLDKSDIPGASLNETKPCQLNDADVKRRPKKHCTLGKSAWKGHYCCVPYVLKLFIEPEGKGKVGTRETVFPFVSNCGFTTR